MNYNVALPTAKRVPILLSIPHCGTAFPDEIKDQYDPGLVAFPDDTDWFVDRLYGFAPSLGITVLSAVWSRWVIDLNRDPDDKPLYSDGRIITGLCPLTTFLGEPLYKDKRTELPQNEMVRRKMAYFNPYHRKLKELMQDIKSEFGRVLLWDCHSIRRVVPTIHPESFPDLILGSADETSADVHLINTALHCLGGGRYNVCHNHPFKGGYITRHYGAPQRQEHALQLEMTKINYMGDKETMYDEVRAKSMEEVLYNTLGSLSETLFSAKDY